MVLNKGLPHLGSEVSIYQYYLYLPVMSWLYYAAATYAKSLDVYELKFRDGAALLLPVPNLKPEEKKQKYFNKNSKS